MVIVNKNGISFLNVFQKSINTRNPGPFILIKKKFCIFLQNS